MTEWAETIALVTGASRGFGRAVSAALGAKGAQIIAVARTVGGLEELDDQIKAAGGPGAVLVPLDITDDAGIARLGAAIHDRWGHVDLWVHTAVQAPILSPVEHVDNGDFDKALNVNLRAFQRLIRSLDPLLRAAPIGRAILCEDGSAPSAYNSAYLSTKAGQSVIAEAWAKGLAATGPARMIRAVLPPMPTALRAKFHPGEDRATLTSVTSVADRLIDRLAGETDDLIDLS